MSGPLLANKQSGWRGDDHKAASLLVTSLGSTMSANDRAHYNETPPLKVGSGVGIASPPMVQSDYIGVRRLTPRECERLQSFPDDWTLIDWNGRPAPDSRRYAAMGDAVTVNVAEWVGCRIMAAEAAERKAA